MKPPPDLNSRRAWHRWACAADAGDPEVVWLGAAGLHRGTWGPATAGRGSTWRPGRPGTASRRASTRWCSSPATHRPCTWPTRAGCSAPPTAGARGGHSASGWPWPRSISWPTTRPGLAGPGSWEPSAMRAARCGARSGPVARRWWPAPSWSRSVAAGWLSPPTADRPGPPSGVLRGSVTALVAAGPGRLLAGTTEGELARLERANGGWVVAGAARPRPGWVAAVATDPERPEVAWAAWSGPGVGGCGDRRTGARPGLPAAGAARGPGQCGRPRPRPPGDGVRGHRRRDVALRRRRCRLAPAGPRAAERPGPSPGPAPA